MGFCAVGFTVTGKQKHHRETVEREREKDMRERVLLM
jgi:hypothetical protein